MISIKKQKLLCLYVPTRYLKSLGSRKRGVGSFLRLPLHVWEEAKCNILLSSALKKLSHVDSSLSLPLICFFNYSKDKQTLIRFTFVELQITVSNVCCESLLCAAAN